MENLPASPSPGQPVPPDRVRSDVQLMVPKTGRIAVVEMVSFNSPGISSHSTDTRFVRHLKSDEQPYIRQLTIGEDWQPLDLGWVKNPSMIIIENREGSFMQVQPTREEREEAAKKVVEIGIRNGETEATWPDWLVRPGENFRGSPSFIDTKIEIRCQHGKAKVTVNIFPE
jgi:hypothetical protein